MRNYIGLAAILLWAASCGKASEEDMWKDTLVAMEEAGQLRYRGYFELSQQGMENLDTVQAVIWFDENDTLIGAAYRFNHAGKMEESYSEGVWRTTLPDEGVMLEEKQAGKLLLQSSLSMATSPVFIQRLLKGVEDSLLLIRFNGDTLIGEQRLLAFSIDMNGHWMAIDGKLEKMENAMNRYDLLIDPNTALPAGMMAYLPQDQGYMSVTFNDLTTDSEAGTGHSLPDVSTDLTVMSLRDYYLAVDARNRLQDNAASPPFILQFTDGSTKRTDELTSKATLLAFWFPGCVPCIETVPALNEIYLKYSGAGLQVYGVEYSDASDTIVNEYIESKGVKYPVCVRGSGIARQLGIMGAPTFVLIDSERNLRGYYNSGQLAEMEAGIFQLLQ